MSLGSFFATKQPVKHRVFISYYHQDDQDYKNRFEALFGNLFINKSVKPGAIRTDNSTEYIKQLIQQDYISDASVIVVLVGPKTYCRKHVDWEISAGLNKKVGGYSGLIGFCLPTHPNFSTDTYSPNIVPPRLVDNLQSGYATFRNWTTDPQIMKSIIENTFDNRINNANLIDNSREQFKNNKCD